MEFVFVNDRPIYMQLVERLRIAIVNGEYPSGSKLPSVRELSGVAKVNPNTMQKALGELEEFGLIYTERTNGKYVTKDTKLIEKCRLELASDILNRYITDMADIGITKQDAMKYLQEGGRK